MPSDGWIKTFEDGGSVKFTYQDLPGEVAFITAQVEGRQQGPLFDPYEPTARTRSVVNEVDARFEGGLLRNSGHPMAPVLAGMISSPRSRACLRSRASRRWRFCISFARTWSHRRPVGWSPCDR